MAPTGSPQPEWVQTCPVSGLHSPWRSQVLRAAQGSHTLQGWGGAEALFLIPGCLLTRCHIYCAKHSQLLLLKHLPLAWQLSWDRSAFWGT